MQFLGWLITMIVLLIMFDRQAEIWKKIDQVEHKVNNIQNNRRDTYL